MTPHPIEGSRAQACRKTGQSPWFHCVARFLRLRVPLVTLLLVSLVGSISRVPASWAGDAPGLSASDQQRLMTEVRRRATLWMEWRRKLVINCPDCEGTGKRVVIVQGGVVSNPCGRCSGLGKRYSKEATWKVIHEFRSPEWRSRAGASRESEKMIQGLRPEDAPLLSPNPWKLQGVELLDADHAVSKTVEGEHHSLVETAWVRSIDSSTKVSSWFLYTPEADGPWPISKDAWLDRGEPMPLLLGILTDATLEPLKLRFGLLERLRAGRRLLLKFEQPELPDGWKPEAAAMTQAIEVVKAVYKSMPADWDTVQMTFSAICQNQYGERVAQPFLRAVLDYQTFRRIHWQNLTEAGAFQLFETERVVPEGWTLVTK